MGGDYAPGFAVFSPGFGDTCDVDAGGGGGLAPLGMGMEMLGLVTRVLAPTLKNLFVFGAAPPVFASAIGLASSAILLTEIVGGILLRKALSFCVGRQPLGKIFTLGFVEEFC